MWIQGLSTFFALWQFGTFQTLFSHFLAVCGCLYEGKLGGEVGVVLHDARCSHSCCRCCWLKRQSRDFCNCRAEASQLPPSPLVGPTRHPPKNSKNDIAAFFNVQKLKAVFKLLLPRWCLCRWPSTLLRMKFGAGTNCLFSFYLP